MIVLGETGPKDKWQVELEKVNRFGLLYCIETLMSRLVIFGGGIGREALLELASHAKKNGKLDASIARHQQFAKNPSKFIEDSLRRSRAAKKAARRRKRAQS